MSMSGQVNQGLKGVRFEGHVDPDELRRAESFRGTDNTLSLVQLPNGRFTIRMHDEVTQGGLVLEAEPAWGLAYLEHNNRQVAAVDHIYPGPFANDATAAAGGVVIGALYRTATGGIAWRQV